MALKNLLFSFNLLMALKKLLFFFQFINGSIIVDSFNLLNYKLNEYLKRYN